MSSKDVVRVTPSNEIIFNYALFGTSTSIIELENITNQVVGFKIKTTAPRKYLVRPSNGTIRAGGSEPVQIILQPLSSDPEKGECKDRFLVQAAVVPSEDVLAKDFWTNLDKSQIQDKRLNVILRSDRDAQNRNENRDDISKAEPAAEPSSSYVPSPNSGVVTAAPAPTSSKKKRSQTKEIDYSFMLVMAVITFFLGRYSVEYF